MNVLPELSFLLSYRPETVLQRYQKDFPNNKFSSEIAFRELLKYLWLSQKHQLDIQAQPDNKNLKFLFTIHSEMKEIDDMWHTFILFTHEYADFSKKYFSTFIHHVPNTEKRDSVGDGYELELTNYLSYIYDNLGEETVRLWFNEPLKAENE